MKLRQLQALQAVADTGSFQAAAEQLCITQPAVSRAIADLEVELGAPLLTRLAKGATLTEFGSTVLKHAQAIDQEVARIQDSAKALRGAGGGPPGGGQLGGRQHPGFRQCRGRLPRAVP